MTASPTPSTRLLDLLPFPPSPPSCPPGPRLFVRIAQIRGLEDAYTLMTFPSPTFPRSTCSLAPLWVIPITDTVRKVPIVASLPSLLAMLPGHPFPYLRLPPSVFLSCFAVNSCFPCLRVVYVLFVFSSPYAVILRLGIAGGYLASSSPHLRCMESSLPMFNLSSLGCSYVRVRSCCLG